MTKDMDLIHLVDTEEEVLEWCGAFCQLYREDAIYLERTAPWVERVGLQVVKDALETKEQREVLYNRFKESQAPAQIDPWKAYADGKDDHKFAPIKVTP